MDHLDLHVTRGVHLSRESLQPARDKKRNVLSLIQVFVLGLDNIRTLENVSVLLKWSIGIVSLTFSPIM